MIKHLQAEIDALGAKIEELIENDEEYRYKWKILQEIPGVGSAVATDILALVPELGEINRRQIASLTGLAPIAKDSGTYRGYRRVNHGRSNLKPSLFLAAMGARKCKNNSYLKEFYERLIDESGKKKMVALTAVMRKIIIIANAKIKNAKLAQNHS
jgi:transposase